MRFKKDYGLMDGPDLTFYLTNQIMIELNRPKTRLDRFGAIIQK